MKNIAEKTATALAIGLATMGNVDAKALETNNANNDIKKAKIELASDMITSNTHDKALKIVDFQNPAKKTETLAGGTEKPFTAEELAKINQVKNKLSELRSAVANATDKTEAQKALDDYRATNANFSQVVKWHKYAVAEIKNLEGSSSRESWMINDKTIDKAFKNSNIAEKVLKYIKRRNQTNFIEKQIGLTSMDSTFAKVLANPKYAGTVKNNPDLNKEIFAGFSPEFQEVFKKMHINLNVKKYDDEGGIIFVSFEYGTRENGEIAKVQFIDSSWEDLSIYVLDTDDYGKVLAQTDAEGITQQLREKDGVIEQTDIMKDGGERPGINAQKNPNTSIIALN